MAAVDQISVHRQGHHTHAVVIKGLGNKIRIGKDVRIGKSVTCICLDHVTARERFAVCTKAVSTAALDGISDRHIGSIGQRDRPCVFLALGSGVRAVGGIVDLKPFLGTQLKRKALFINARVLRELYLENTRTNHGIFALAALGTNLLQLRGSRLIQVDLMEAAVILERGTHRDLALGHIIHGKMAVIVQLCGNEIRNRAVNILHKRSFINILPLGRKRKLHVVIVQDHRPLGII